MINSDVIDYQPVLPTTLFVVNKNKYLINDKVRSISSEI